MMGVTNLAAYFLEPQMTRALVSVLLIGALLCGTLLSAEAIAEYQLKAEFIERFTRFVEWPTPPLQNGHTPPFVIGIIGRDPFEGFLSKMAKGRKIKGREVELRAVSDDNIDGCDILFISSSEERHLGEIVGKTSSRPVLTIGDTPGYAEKGVLINFYTTNEQIRFEINPRAADKTGLKLSSKLFGLARVVTTEGR